MYVNIGENNIIDEEDIIGIFDMDKITVFKTNRNYLSNIQKRGKIKSSTQKLPKSFIVCAEKRDQDERVYLSQFLPCTLLKRVNLLDLN